MHFLIYFSLYGLLFLFSLLLFFKKLKPTTSVLKTLASNRLRIDFEEPQPPKNEAEAQFRKLKATVDEEGYSKTLEKDLRELGELFKNDDTTRKQFLETTNAMVLLCKFVGCTGFELSKRRRTPQDYKNLDAAVSCLSIITVDEAGLSGLIETNEAVYDLYLALHYAEPNTKNNILHILTNVANFSEKGYSQLFTAMQDYMYIPGNEDYFLSHLISSVGSLNQSLYSGNVVEFLVSLAGSEFGGENAAMLRTHLQERNVLDTLSEASDVTELERVLEEGGAEITDKFHTTPHDKYSCYSHQFSSRVRWYSRLLNCLFSVLPAKLPIGGALCKFTDEYRANSIKKMDALKQKKRTGEHTAEEVQRFNREMSALTLGVGSDFFDHMLECGMFEETRKFIDKAETIENWNHEELLQAGRNVWTCFGLEMILYGQNVTMSDAYLGYSLLYPYTDNYLDDDSITKEDKKIFQDLFTKRLAGHDVKARSEEEQKIWDCVTLIENRFDRKKFPNAFNCLIAINEAQTKSLKQHTKEIPPEELIQEITMEKGGTSVLSDGYLVHGDMSEEDALFTFGLGVALQLVDDLQDTSRDIAVNQHTMCTLPFLLKQPCDSVACRLLQLMEVMVNPDHYSLEDRAHKLRYAMLKMTNTIAMKAIAKYCYIFTEDFVELVAECSPIPLTHLSRVNNMARMLQMVRSNQI
eukprot:CAMPEP_0174250864 /NCGR_PEP_ID=MMETSP0439-20130205/888_1 /TAXON_ID=0 /ORGANISM="Stereomyxa ramosa, Strain Chinc5" /LENGTH=693 /DNA_ID=CAMNT_0015331037 /DNA_START=67 /DNA_END=2148 /DNA_ORIENTATION=-